MKDRSHNHRGFTPLIAFGNEAPIHYGSGDIPVGVIALANESRLTAATYSEALTQYTVGYRDPENLLATLDYIAPPIPASRRFEWKKSEESNDFVTETDDERAIGAGFKRVEYTGKTQLGKTRNRGLTYIIDTDEDGGAVSEESVVAMLQRRIIRNKFRRAMTALEAAAGAGTGKVFSSETQPDEIMRAALATAQESSGIYPNRGLLGLAAWNMRKAAYAASEKPVASASARMTLDEVAADLGLDDLRVDRALYQSSKTGKSRIVGSNFYGFIAHDGLTKDDPSHLKQFFTPLDGGGRWRVFRRVFGPADKFIEITVEHYDDIVATSTIGIARLNITAS